MLCDRDGDEAGGTATAHIYIHRHTQTHTHTIVVIMFLFFLFFRCITTIQSTICGRSLYSSKSENVNDWEQIYFGQYLNSLAAAFNTLAPLIIL